MKIVTVAEMVRIERASDAAGHSYDAMMELAGRAVAAATLRHMHPWDSDGGVLVLAGPGNNGGDGLVAARYLHTWEPRRPVAVYCWKRSPEGDPNYEALRRLRLPIVHAEEDPDFSRLRELVQEADVIVDALLGTGVSRPISGPLAALLDAVRQAIAQRRQEEALAAEEVEETEPVSRSAAARALRPVADFDFLWLPPVADQPLPQVVAVDCPSGLNCDTGRLDPASLRADLTVTFANPKVGHFIVDGPAACGRLEVADIGTDPSLADQVTLQLATPDWVKSLLPPRPVDAHKGTFGRTMVVAGSANYTGAAHLAAAAAYRVGAGLVTLAVPGSLHPTLAAGLVEATWLLLPEALGVLSPDAVKVLLEGLEGYAALLVGPGLTQEKEAVQFVHRLLGVGAERKKAAGFLAGVGAAAEAAPTGAARREVGVGFMAAGRGATPASAATTAFLPSIPLVVDADALNALAQAEGWHEHLPAHCVLTPHPGEMARLCGCSTAEVRENRINLARAKAAEWRQIVLLKGAYTVVAAPDGRAAVLPFANPALATAGSGDVLAGAIVGMLSQGLAPFEAAVVGGYLHGLAGELARREIGDAGVTAGDLLARLPAALRQLRAA
ncbi:MAG: bifunctional ADP-dependent NAD(P)H-hydrate dehydratase/NAD(P)H-hydrate epimerase [Anaerolineae bacterium]|nr:bifunctional ADP-dependent NAD(P)H-hydrate dehydratase/NAD(P)H-hydrate epimerase [Anaerolineae bacterium]